VAHRSRLRPGLGKERLGLDKTLQLIPAQQNDEGKMFYVIVYLFVDVVEAAATRATGRVKVRVRSLVVLAPSFKTSLSSSLILLQKARVFVLSNTFRLV
jgi:hypothetical protein